MSSISGIQGHILEVTVVGCTKLRDTELFSRQDPYVCLEYANSKFRTRTCTDGGKTPTFQEKFQIPLIEGLREISVAVWNSNTFTADDFIGSARVQLHKVLSHGYDDTCWPLQTKNFKFAGEVKFIMHFQNALHKPPAHCAPSAPPYMSPPPPPPVIAPYAPPYASPYTAGAYPGAASYASYPPPAPAPYQTCVYPTPPPQQFYAPQSYPPPPYPPQPYMQQYPPSPAQPYYPPGPYPGSYPPPY